MKTLIATVVIAAMLAGPACAQTPHDNLAKTPHEQDMARDAARQHERERADIEKEYNETIKRTGPQHSSPKSDPWGAIRSSGGTAKPQ
jgi:Ni/Co efflux regulator RcnB